MALTLSNAAASATTPQQKDQLPNPFELQDSHILHKVYLTHVNDDKECDKDILINLVSNTLISASPQNSGTTAVPTSVTSFKPDFPTLKRISCQMITTRGTPQCAHQTTLWILRQLSGFSWDAKALITLAAFSLEYGEFSLLHRIKTSDQFGNSLKQLNQVESRKVSADMSDLVTVLVQVLTLINQWARWSAMDYDTEEVPSLPEALQQIPLVVYWTIAAVVASIGNLLRISEHKLSDFKGRLDIVVIKLKSYLEHCRLQIDMLHDDQSRITKPIKDVVDLLETLIRPGPGTGTSIPQIYEGRVPIKQGTEVFKQKYVMLFISDLGNIGDEILLLNSIYNNLQENPEQEIKGFKKGDFKILWIPVVDSWQDPALKERFKTFREDIKWYVLEYFDVLPGYGALRKKFNYEPQNGENIVSVINPQGQIINQNARQILFEWKIKAFPFRQIDEDDLYKKWKWFWNLMEKTDPKTKDMGRKDNTSYVFIYGGNDSKWVQNMSIEIGKIKRHKSIKNVDVTIEGYQLGEENLDNVPKFWIGIDGKKQNKLKCNGGVDCEIQEVVRTLLCLKQDPLGWVLLSRGRNIMLLGHAEPMYQTLVDFEIWKDKVLEKETFDVAFEEYYDVVKERYARRPYDYSSSVLATISCPNPTCGRVMEVTSINYRCCHGSANSCSI